MDFKSQTKLVNVYPNIEEKFYTLWSRYKDVHGKELKVSEGMRTYERQQELYNKGRSEPGPIVTHSKPGWSFHQYGLAVDVFFAGKDPYLEKDPRFEYYWKEFGRIAEEFGFVWGGHFSGLKDRPHIQLSYGLTITELFQLYKKGKLVAVWNKLDLLREAQIPVKSVGICSKIKTFFKGE